MSYRENAMPEVDTTEVQIARIREAEEMKRQLNEERETTRRQRIVSAEVMPSTMFGFVAVLVTIVGGITFGYYLSSRTDGVCTPKAEIINVAAAAFKCPGGTITHDKLDGERVLARCSCGEAK